MFSKYESLKIIGSGTFGKVHLVSSKSSGNVYVMKEVRLSSMTAKEKQQALTEVTILSKCKHKNIIRYKEASIDPEKGVLSIVMEYAQCGDLYSIIKKRKGAYFKEQEVLSWFVQITFALQYIHKNNILHRDLKTRNIFLTIENVIKIGDFGIARVLKESQELANTAIGTPYYLSPEICLRKPYNSKSDMWALGCVLFEMSSLVHPFQAKGFHQLVIAILNVKYGQLPKHCSILIKDLVKALLNSDPEKRPSADDILSTPTLQPYVRHHQRNISFQLSDSVVETDHRMAMRKGAGPRRFSSNDILDAKRVSPFAKRRSSSSMAAKNGAKGRFQASGVTTLSEKYPSNASSLNDEVFQSSVLSTTYSLSKELQTVVPKDMPSSHCMAGTYTLNVEHPNSNDKTRDGNTRRPTFKSLISRLAKQSKIPKPTKVEESSNNAAFQASTSQKYTNCSSKGVDSCPKEQCPHAPQCNQCLMQVLWKNRIRRNGLVDEAEKAKLKTKLQLVFGQDTFTDVCNELFVNWESYGEGSDFLITLTQKLTIEQMQWFPLLMQFVQLDLKYSYYQV